MIYYIVLLCFSAVLAVLCVKNKRLAVYTLLYCGVVFVSTDRYLVKRAEIAGMSVVCALSYRAGDRVVGFLVHFHDLTPSCNIIGIRFLYGIPLVLFTV